MNINAYYLLQQALLKRKERDKMSTDGINPKDKIGSKKVDLSLIPTSALVEVARCMENGAKKYGPFNWRNPDQKVQYMTYISANIRHALSFLDGENYASDSGLSHLAHACAGLMVLIDAINCGNVIDNRPIAGVTGKLLDEYIKKD